MKKAAAALALIPIVLIFCSCSINREPKEICVERIFTAKLNIQFNQTAFTADFTCDENGCSAVFLLPEEVNGLKVTTDGKSTVISLGELSFTADETNDQTQLINAVYSAINGLPDSASEAEKNYTLQGTNRYGKYVMNIDTKSMIPTFIEYEEIGITVKIEPNA